MVGHNFGEGDLRRALQRMHIQTEMWKIRWSKPCSVVSLCPEPELGVLQVQSQPREAGDERAERECRR